VSRLSEISKSQIDLMAHTMSEGGRNWFGTSLECKDAKDFDDLVKRGLAYALNAPSWSGDDVIYGLTPEGKAELSRIYTPVSP
jgi:hypothetical protein